MAKKQAMNVFEAHLEKILLGVAVAVFIWVIISQVFQPPGINVDGVVQKTSQATGEMAKRAEKIAGDISLPGSLGNLPKVDLPSDIIVSHPLKEGVAETLYLSQPVPGQTVAKPRGPYMVPDMLPALMNPKMLLTRAEVWVPTTEKESVSLTRGGLEAEDTDFVTIEATLPLDDLRRLFDDHFGRGTKDPLENSAPIVAVVELQHSQLMPDGDWGEYQTLPRLPVDDMFDKALSPVDIDRLSQAFFDVRREEWKSPVTQILLLKPDPYELVKGEWVSPSEKAEVPREDRRERRGGAITRQDRDKPEDRRPPVRQPAAPTDGGMPGMGMPGMGMPGMPGMGMGLGEPGMAPTRTTVATTKYDVEKDYINAKKITFWAHDGQVEPGEIYRYRLRVGFFNPVAGHDNWVMPDQAQTALQRVLWTSWIEPRDVARIPQRILFFPKQGGGSVLVEVYRWQQGRWFTHSFPAFPGTVIGDIRPSRSEAGETRRPVARRTTEDSSQEIDFRTEAMVVDIIPETRYYLLQGSALMEMTTSELVYRDRVGQIKHIPVDSRAWPEEMRTLNSEIKKNIREEERPANRPGAPGMPGGQGPGAMPGVPGMPGM